MGVSINVQAKTDYSYLFSSLGTSAANAISSNWLGDYAAIKNGSYAKLMKAYYSSNSSDEVKSLVSSSTTSQSSSLSEDDAQTLAEVQSTTDALKETADKLIATDEDSVFADEDMDAIYSAVKAFVDDYNSVITAASSASSTSIANRLQNMVNITSVSSNSLAKVGITINSDNTLSIDEDTFKSADLDKIENLFQEKGSYGYNISAQASYINYAADQEVSKANTYTYSGTYSSSYSSGSIFSAWL